ncbi:MAG: Gfo/Idh/MocA family oxidoreductase [Thermotogae bacterium]|nr:Gfo/Idh/MocA family oxidoreductase [Thermotogota bacterium]
MKIGILSCDHMHAESYVESLKRIEKVEIAGIGEENEKRGKDFAQRHGIKYFKDYEDILSDKSVDAVVICSANAKHAKMTIDSARAKKHVIVEKPIATTIEDAQRMIDACRENKVKLMVSFPVRYAPPIKRMKEIIDDGKLGEIIGISATNHGTMPGGWFTDKALSGGGSIIDHTVHVVDILRWIFKSEVKEVYAKMGTLIHDIPVEDCAIISMKFENEVFATLDASWSRPKSFPTWGDVTFEIAGTKGSMNVDAFAQHGIMYSDDIEHSKYAYWGDDMDYLMLKDFVKCIEDDLREPVTGKDGLEALRVALMAYESVKKDKVIKV